jgi:phosphohistidine phosphatase
VEILVVRHAIAFTRDPMQWPDDHLRPLSPKGESRFRKEARGLAKVTPHVDLLLTSPWLRSHQTAEILHRDAGWPEPEPCEALEGDRSPRGVLSVLRSHPKAGIVALVGHEPQASQLASYLLTGDAARMAIQFKKGGVAAFLIERPLRPGTAILEFCLPPGLLRSLA